MASFDLQKLARPNILALEPYRCARDDYKVGVLLDANENTHGPSLTTIDEYEKRQELNRYPDPHQTELKERMCEFRNRENTDESLTPLDPSNLFVGVGSDEAIDAIIRILCVPGKDKLLTCPPTYGMYGVSAQINDVEVVKVNLDFEPGSFGIRPEAINETLANNPSIKLAYLCSPGNPTGSLLKKELIEQVLNHPTWNGMVVVDEAYIDFAPEGSSFAPLATKYPNLIVMQTLSKSFGLAGARLGITFSSKEMASLLNNMKAPYNISTPSSELALRALSPEGIALMKKYVKEIVVQRERLVQELPKIPGVGAIVGGNESNFLLIQVLDKPNGKPDSDVAKQLYKTLAEKKNVVIRYRGSEPGCVGCLRISVGTKQETDVLLTEIKDALNSIQSV
jgi:histidinol-phosphate aminotransferase